jgi:glutamate-5-semialdehyde dehydrogenase
MNIKESLIDRLRLNEKRINGMVDGIRKVIDLNDPVWKSDRVWTLENGLTVSKMTVPLGVIGIIYESRPNVTVEAFSLALKSGNGILLRGSSSAINSNRAIVNAIKEGLEKSSISMDVIEFIDTEDRLVVGEMLTLNKYIDVIIPRGGEELIQYVVKNSTVPTIETGVGNCHIFVDETADIEKAIDIVKNAKVQRPGVCNACETVLVHKNIAEKFLPKLYEALNEVVELRGCSATKRFIEVKEATEEDWAEEYLDYILAIKIVEDVHEAIDHIEKYGTKHSEAILTENLTNANIFQREVDAAAVYVNASTRFTDGGQFGYGGEMGISTQKIHARGPVGLNELVTVKYTIMGNGQIRE